MHWHESSSSNLQSFLAFAFLSLHLEVFIFYFHQQDRNLTTHRLSSGLSLIFCISKLLECIVLTCLPVFLKDNQVGFANAHPLMLFPSFLLALPLLLETRLSLAWCSLYLLYALAMNLSCITKVRFLIIFILFIPTISCFGLMVLLPLLLAKKALASLPTTYFVGLRSPFSVWQAQYVQALFLKPVPFCKLLVSLGNTNKTASSVPFSSQTLALFLLQFHLLRSSIYLTLSDKSCRNCPFSPFTLDQALIVSLLIISSGE